VDGLYLGGGSELAAVLLLDDHLMRPAFGLEGVGRKQLHAQCVLERADILLCEIRIPHNACKSLKQSD
jgi:hypothetical protein